MTHPHLLEAETCRLWSRGDIGLSKANASRRRYPQPASAALAFSSPGAYGLHLVHRKPRRVGLIGAGWHGKSSLWRLVRPMVDRAAQLTGVLRWREECMRRGVTVLMYHRVLPDEQCAAAPLPGLVMPASAFAEQVNWLAKHCRVMTVRDALGALEAQHESPATNGDSLRANGDTRPIVAMSFDDGYRDNHAYARPILEAHNVPATFFITAGLIGTQRMLWYDIAARAWHTMDRDTLQAVACDANHASGTPPEALATLESLELWMAWLKALTPTRRHAVVEALADHTPALAKPGNDVLMDWAELAELAGTSASGKRLHEIGAHTCTHPLLPQLDDASLQHEIHDAKGMLEHRLDVPISGFCYPNGDHDARVVDAVRRAGYTYACTTAPGMNLPGADPMRITRIDMTAHRVLNAAGRWNALGFRSELCGLREVMRRTSGRT